MEISHIFFFFFPTQSELGFDPQHRTSMSYQRRVLRRLERFRVEQLCPSRGNGLVFLNPVATLRLPFRLIGNVTKGLSHIVKLMSSTSSVFFLFVFDSMLGALHWLAEDGPVVAYNPNDQKTCLFIHRSQEIHHAYYGGDAAVSETLTISMSHLRILQLVEAAGHRHLSIWTLVDYKQSIWKQEHDPISFTDLPWLQDWRTSSTQHNTSLLLVGFRKNQKTRERILYPQPLCCHPYNPQLVYFCLSESIVSLDVATKKLQLITRLSKRGTEGVYWNQYDKVIPMTMQLDPSLVPDHGHVL
ncbi:unnamed protein product [Arabis nemorensis]|uniref:Uncharacterized protein n=1 Tax=Arabis nemorensis TaxID=586526 RepID=A0A565BTN0_9BRAS|nr:unnamed protein product [Arabis nemorensis]